jgi:cysteinyl-tRNA synthetase
MEFFEAMDDDFNTPNALRSVFGLVRDLNRRLNEDDVSQEGLQVARDLLEEFGEVLGLDLSPRESGEERADRQKGDLIDLLLRVRQRLREKREWELADEIREGLLDQNIIVEDAAPGKRSAQRD